MFGLVVLDATTGRVECAAFIGDEPWLKMAAILRRLSPGELVYEKVCPKDPMHDADPSP